MDNTMAFNMEDKIYHEAVFSGFMYIFLVLTQISFKIDLECVYLL